jgi:hypothetical protein
MEDQMEDPIELSVELRGMDLVRRYYESRGWAVENVSRVRGGHGGYDYLVSKGSEQLKVEVKGCSRPFGIPDPYHTEFHAGSRQLIADVMCVAYFIPGKEPQLAIIPRAAILPEYVTQKIGYRISGRFKNARMISPFFVEL